MNITNILQIHPQQDAISFTGKVDQYLARPMADATNQPVGSSAPVTPDRTPVEDHLQTVVARIDILQEQINTILVSFPPFFPIGSYQRADLIETIKGIQVELEKIPARDGALPTPPLTGDAGDAEIAAVLQSVFQFRDNVSRQILVNPLEAAAGAILNIMA